MRGRIIKSVCGLILLSLASPSSAELVDRILKVTFVSADLVYLNGGRSEGLQVGARPTVLRDGQSVAEIEVLHIAEHTSACRFVGPAVSVHIGDTVRISIDLKSSVDTLSDEGTAPTAASTTGLETVGDFQPAHASTLHPSASGSIAVLYSNWDDQSDYDLDFAQGRVDLDLRVQPLWISGLSLSVRTSGRQDRRSISGNSGSDDSWESRIATFSLEYKPDGSRVGMSMGRINPARVGAIGRLDGGSVEYRISEPLRIGLFAGANSQWLYSENRPELQTYGMFTGYRHGSARDLLVDQTMSIVGQYHGGITSREALLAQGRITRNSHWSISHSVEMDFNRGWRKGDGDASMDLSTVFAQGRLQLTRSVSASLSYDTRKSFRTYETRDIADSIFDDRVRQGMRTQVDINLPEGIVLTAGAGVRSVADESDRTISYNGAIRKQGLLNAQSSLNLQGSTFESDATSGYNVSASIGQGIRQRDWLSFGAGLYSYKLAGDSVPRVNHKIDLTTRISLTSTLAFNASGQLAGGDDTLGHRLEAGFSVRF